MQKTKKSRFAIVAVLIFSMVAMYGYMPVARAASLTSVSDTISDSDVSVSNVTHTVAFTTGQALTQNYRIDVTFPDEVNMAVATSTCPASSTASIAGKVVTCTVDSGQTLATGAYTITVASTTNPTAGGYTVQIVTETDAAVEVENGSARFYILDDVTVTAHVDASLTFTVDGLASTTVVNGVICSVDTASTSMDFETLDNTSSTTVCQQLTVVTNASGGYSVTVAQDHNLESAVNADIDEFANGSGGSVAAVWSSPTASLGSENTYGHFGLTSEDAVLAAGNTFGDALYVGFDESNAVEVMYHNGPANGAGEGVGLTQVAYTAEVSSLQEAGDYTNALTYVATAIY
ncbi:hypothetical protein KAI92_02480 [Candidatus Parcubacteria bacterium]|nr:hypothetical protein [Candidatus Parcubacteria bacterium]